MQVAKSTCGNSKKNITEKVELEEKVANSRKT